MGRLKLRRQESRIWRCQALRCCGICDQRPLNGPDENESNRSEPRVWNHAKGGLLAFDRVSGSCEEGIHLLREEDITATAGY
jgi:hypothetical protein